MYNNLPHRQIVWGVVINRLQNTAFSRRTVLTFRPKCLADSRTKRKKAKKTRDYRRISITFAPKSEKMRKEEPSKNTAQHPLILLGERVEREGVVIIDDVTNQPLDGEPYISPYAIVALCQQGMAQSEYDMKRVEFHAHDMTIMRKGHVVRSKNISADYRARLVIMSNPFLEKLRLRESFQFNTHSAYYYQHPAFHLSDEQYRQMNEAFDMLKTVSTVGHRYREEMLLSALNIIFMLRYEFCPIPEPTNDDAVHLLSVRFKEAVIEHHRQSHEVSFYARMFCLSPKYFSTLIKQDMGVTAGEWIDRYVVLQAKTLLSHRRDLNIQQTADLLGFTEQASFSRFFKNKTGLSPTEYREQKEQ